MVMQGDEALGGEHTVKYTDLYDKVVHRKFVCYQPMLPQQISF